MAQIRMHVQHTVDPHTLARAEGRMLQGRMLQGQVRMYTDIIA
jgi:hypothetical protein